MSIYTKTNSVDLKNNKMSTKKVNKKLLVYLIIWICIFVILPIILALKFIDSNFYISVSSNSMYPIIVKGDKLMVSKIESNDDINNNDIVTFRSKELNRILVKRVVGVPGDLIEIDQNYNLKVNGEEIIKNSNIIFSGEYDYDVVEEKIEVRVPENSYFLVGDNSDNSFDSRFWNQKFIDREDIFGKVRSFKQLF